MSDESPRDRLERRAKPSEPPCRPTSSTAHRRPRSRDRVYDHIFFTGEWGSTDEEGYQALEMPSQSYAPRRGELVVLGLVKPSKFRRQTSSGSTATVWVASAFLEGKRDSSGGSEQQGGGAW